jgi:streptogramin lyase
MKAVSLVAAVLVVATAAASEETYHWTTIAGNAPYGIADGTNNTARFNLPSSVAVDFNGNVYVADTSNHTVRKLTPTGTNWVVTTIAGRAQWSGSADGSNSEARFDRPSGLTVDTEGNLYVADAGNNTIRRVTPMGTNWVVSTIAGQAGNFGTSDGFGDTARFNNPSGVAVDANGVILYVSDTSNNTIRKLTRMGTGWMVSTIAGNAGAGGATDGWGLNAMFFKPKGIVTDKNGNLFVADYGENTIRKLTPSGGQWMVSTIIGVARYVGEGPSGIALDAEGNLYIADNSDNTIRRATPTATNWVVSTIAGKAGAYGSIDGTNDAARFGLGFYYNVGPTGVAVDASGNVYVADAFNNTIRRITPSGTNWVVSTIAGQTIYAGNADGTNYDARFNRPWGVAADLNGNVYVTDTGNQTIRMLTQTGTNWAVSTIAGKAGSSGRVDGTNSAARFDGAAGVAVDTNGTVFVADGANQTIRKLTQMGTNWVVTTIAGLAGRDGRADGTNNLARFFNPAGVAMDAGGNVFVADTGNESIRKVTPVGTDWVVTTVGGTNRNVRFEFPLGVAADREGNIYVGGPHTLSRIAPSGAGWVVNTIGNPSAPGSVDGTNNGALFTRPSGLGLDQAGNIYVADPLNNNIRKITRVGTDWVVSTIGGLAGSPGGLDGTNSAARFSSPGSIAVDKDGKVYVADSGNNTIRLGVPVSMVGFLAGVVTTSIDRQTGLFYQQVVVTNIGAGTIHGLRISATNLPADVQLVSATGTNAATGGPFVEFTNALTAGATLTFTLSYYSPNRQAPVGVGVSVEPVVATPYDVGSGETVTIRRTFLRPDGNRGVEFDSLNGRTYAMQYSSNLTLWKQAQSLVAGNGGRMIWVDAGPPDTESSPSSSRFYRVILLPQ